MDDKQNKTPYLNGSVFNLETYPAYFLWEIFKQNL